MPADVFSLAKDALKHLGGKLIDIRESRKLELQRLSDGFGDPVELAKFYIEPDCQHFPPADENEEESPSSLREPILRLIDRYLSGAATHSRQHMFILSDAGMGKTSLLLILKLSHLTSFWPQQFHCELLKLGDRTLNEIEAIKDKSNTILLLDALDEDPLAWGQIDNRVSQILKATQSFRRVLITCRTQFFNPGDAPYSKRGQIEVSGFDCPVIYNSLFSDGQCVEYLERRSLQRRDDPSWLVKAEGIALRMGSLKMRPMLLAHIDDLLEEDAVKWTEYEVYTALIRNWLKREQRKILSETDRYPAVDELLRACRNIAIYLHARKVRHLSQKELNDLIQDSPETQSIELMHFGGRSLLNRDSKGNYRFSHYSIQEYLVVSAILEGEIPVRNLLVQATDFMLRLFSIWRESASVDQLMRMRLDGLSLKGARFSNQTLRDVDFSSTDLSDSDFSGADLTGANFSKSNLANSTFSNAILDGTVFNSANMENAKLDGAKGKAQMQWANLAGSNLSGADFSKANLNFARIKGAIYTSRTKLPLAIDAEREGAIRFTD